MRVARCSTAYLRFCQIFFISTVTASAVGFTSSISWCKSAIWITVVSSLISLMMWTVKAPCYVPLWSPGFRSALRDLRLLCSFNIFLMPCIWHGHSKQSLHIACACWHTLHMLNLQVRASSVFTTLQFQMCLQLNGTRRHDV